MPSRKLFAALLLLFAVGLDVRAVNAQDFEDQVEEDLVDEGERVKLGQTGMQFLSVSLDPRASALGNAVAAVEMDAAAMFYNPAGMAFMQPSLSATIGQNQFITDIRYNFGALAYRWGNIGTFGIHALSVDYGTVQTTIRAENDAGYVDTGTIEPSALAVGVGYARPLTDRFAVGGNVKYVRQDLGSALVNTGGETGDVTESLDKSTAVWDFGVLYRTGFRSLNFAVNVRNFAGELRYAEHSFELPLNFRIGASMNMVDLTSIDPSLHSLNVSVDATHPRAYWEQLKVGGEYTFMDVLSLRAGYTFPADEEGVNLGAGVHTGLGEFGIGFDYAYTDFGIFDKVHRLAVRLAFQ